MSVSSGQKLLCLGTAQQVGGAVSELVARVNFSRMDRQMLTTRVERSQPYSGKDKLIVFSRQKRKLIVFSRQNLTFYHSTILPF